MIYTTFVIVTLISISVGYVLGNKNPQMRVEKRVKFIASITQSMSVVLALIVFGYQYTKDKEDSVSDKLKYAFETVQEYNKDVTLETVKLMKEYFYEYGVLSDEELKYTRKNPSERLKLESRILELSPSLVNYVYDANTCIEANVCDKDFTVTRVCHQISVPHMVLAAMKDHNSNIKVEISGHKLRKALIISTFKNFDSFKKKYC
ncbi:hypothetical protein [Vibrio coralliilyticus]|uniref:Uncharacterized protein n=1 Tax=Vibrio coralliilyticus TaxID=190893 RepID=A0AAP6ZK74_9VIBR|nr:hypothetical protein [Vibrio coralliilyticus]NOJ21846.1 hypothetical protein [Vibrio coralliilyticus]